MEQQVFKEYALLKIQQEEIQQALDEKKNIIMAEMAKAGATSVETPLGTFSLQKRETMKFDDEELTSLKVQVKQREVELTQMGEGDVVTTEFIKFTKN